MAAKTKSICILGLKMCRHKKKRKEREKTKKQRNKSFFCKTWLLLVPMNEISFRFFIFRLSEIFIFRVFVISVKGFLSRSKSLRKIKFANDHRKARVSFCYVVSFDVEKRVRVCLPSSENESNRSYSTT